MVTIRCGNPACTSTAQIDESLVKSNRPADYLSKLPGRWSIAYAPLRLVASEPGKMPFSYVCCEECAVNYAAHLAAREAREAKGASILLH